MEIKEDEVVFSSGRKRYANCGTIGLTPQGNVTEGWDGGFYNKDLEDLDDLREPEERLTSADLVELADYMIRRWTEFRTRAKEKDRAPR